MSKRERIQKELDDLYREKSNLVEEQKEVEHSISKLKNIDNKTPESKEVLEQQRSKFRDIESRQIELKSKIQKLERKRESLPGTSDPEVAELSDKLENVSEELTDVKLERDRLQEKVKSLRSIRDSARDLLEALSKNGVLNVARDAEKDKNIYSSRSASLWTGDLWSVQESAQSLREELS